MDFPRQEHFHDREGEAVMERGNTKQEILEAPLELFSVQGFEATSISQIASAVGIRKASLYSHFQSKQAILDAIVEDVLKQYDGAISLYYDSVVILKKIHSADDSRQPDVASDGDELSAREKEILVCVAQGMLNKEIADKFSLSIYTVITHRKNITRKTGIKTVAGLTVYAILNNLIDINSVQ